MTKKKGVVVTGASTGTGLWTTQVLLARGFRVFGSVRQPADADRLQREVGRGFRAVAPGRDGGGGRPPRRRTDRRPVMPEINGFCGASSIERLPAERAITAQVRAFKERGKF